VKLSVVNVSTWYPEAIEQAQLGCDQDAVIRVLDDEAVAVL